MIPSDPGFYDSKSCLLQEGLHAFSHPHQSHPFPQLIALLGLSLNALYLSGTPNQPRSPGPGSPLPTVLGLVGGLSQRCRRAAIQAWRVCLPSWL